MALFDVPGWSVAAEPVATSKKRKRPANQDADKAQSLEINMDKLMKRFDDDKKTFKSDRKKKGKLAHGREEADDEHAKSSQPQLTQGKGSGGLKSNVQAHQRYDAIVDADRKLPVPTKKKKGKSKSNETSKREVKDNLAAPVKPTVVGLTSLQTTMKNSLEGARFRWINETLYKSDSAQAHQIMKDDPHVYDEYHTGFRHQVKSWPSNPVSHYINDLSSYPSRTVIADLGCGDAALSRALIPKDLNVLSFDLVSDGCFIVEADICSKLPLPGSEGTSEGKSEGKGQIVDVVVCSLSLMGTNWVNCVREAWRILRPSGELKVAEVTSRFTDVDDFCSLIATVGFKLKVKDENNTHFTLFEFKKVARGFKTEKEWLKLVSRGTILEPCEYKRR